MDFIRYTHAPRFPSHKAGDKINQKDSGSSMLRVNSNKHSGHVILYPLSARLAKGTHITAHVDRFHPSIRIAHVLINIIGIIECWRAAFTDNTSLTSIAIVVAATTALWFTSTARADIRIDAPHTLSRPSTVHFLEFASSMVFLGCAILLARPHLPAALATFASIIASVIAVASVAAVVNTLIFIRREQKTAKIENTYR